MYVVLHGEFQSTYELKISPPKKKIDNLPRHTKEGMLSILKNLQSPRGGKRIVHPKTTFNFQCCNLNWGFLFGEEDAITQSDHTKSIKCLSQEGVLLVMSNADFLAQVK